MNKRLITVIATVTLSGLLLTPGCTSVEPPIAEAIPTQAQDTSEAEPITAPTNTQDTYNQLDEMADKQINFQTPLLNYAGDFPLDYLSELESKTISIVKATPVSSVPSSYMWRDESNTLTTIRIDEVILSDGKIYKDDKIILVEYFNIGEDPNDENVLIVWSSSGSLPMRKDTQYLLFLQKSPQSYAEYAVTSVYQGKYPITEKTLTNDAKDLTSEDLELLEKHYDDSMISLTQQVLDKYLR